jgi:hypothetical protein
MDLLTFSDSVIFNPRCRESGTVLSKLLKLGHNKNYSGTFPSCMATWPSMQNAINSTHALKIKQNSTEHLTTFCLGSSSLSMLILNANDIYL